MKIICLIDSLGPGGAQRQLVGLSVQLRKHGWDVAVVIYHNNLFFSDDLLSNGVPYIYLQKANNKISRIFQICRYIRQTNPDWVISYLETPSICSSLAHITNKNFKLIVSERNTTQKTGKNEKIRFNLFRTANYVVPNAYAQEDYIKQNFPFLSNKIVTIPNFVDLLHFLPSYHKRNDTPEIIVVATIWPPKNTLGFINAIEILSKSVQKFHISWYGKDISNIEYFIECQQKVEEKNLCKYISLLDKTNKIAEHYQEADYFCLPSFYEGTPNVICEAMASGLPIICSDVCDNPRYVSEEKNGYLFNPNDSKSIATIIEKILGLNDEEYIKFCKRSRSIAEEKLSEERFINDYIKLIEQ